MTWSRNLQWDIAGSHIVVLVAIHAGLLRVEAATLLYPTLSCSRVFLKEAS